MKTVLVLLLLLLGGLSPLVRGTTLFILSNNSGLDNLFTASGTDFLNIDGNGLNLNIKGTLNEGTADLISLPAPFGLRIVSGKRSAVKLDYDLALTFSAPVTDFFFGTKGTTNQENFTLDLSTNPPGGVWSENAPYPGTTYASTSGIGTVLFNAVGPNGGNPATSITLASNPVLQARYNLAQTGANSSPEDYFWGSATRSPGGLVVLPASIVPEPSTFLLAATSLLALALRRRRR